MLKVIEKINKYKFFISLFIIILLLIQNYNLKKSYIPTPPEYKQTGDYEYDKRYKSESAQEDEMYKDKPSSCIPNLSIQANLTDEILNNNTVIELIKNNCLWASPNNPIDSKDIDRDSKKEVIFKAGPAGAATGRFVIWYLIDDGNVVFTDSGDTVDIQFTNNGFTVKNTHPLYDGPGCCPDVFQLKKYTYDGEKVTLISTETINEHTFTQFLPVKENSYWEYSGIKKEQQTNGEILTENINKKILVTKIEDFDNKTIVYLKGDNTPFMVAKNYTIDFEPLKSGEDKLVLKFPLEKGARWGSSIEFRDDGYYGWEIEQKMPMNILGKNYENCYRIAYKTLSDTSYKIFCYGIGFVEEGYIHNGTAMEYKYELVSTNVDN